MRRRVRRFVEVIHCDCCKHTTDNMDDKCESKYGDTLEFDKCLLCFRDICPCCMKEKPEEGCWVFICKKCSDKGYEFFQGDLDDAKTSIYKNGKYNYAATKKLRNME